MTILRNRPIALLVLDGFGYNPSDIGNAVKAARTPNIDRYRQHFPHTLIKTSGLDVGLPDGQMGNSEVGHTNIGAGRIVYQELTRITQAIEDGNLARNPVLAAALGNCHEQRFALHLLGLLFGRRCTATTRIFMLCAEMARDRSQKSTFTVFMMAVMFRPTPARVIRKSWKRSLLRLVWARLPRSWAATMPWTGITAGSGSKKPIAMVLGRRCGR